MEGIGGWHVNIMHLEYFVETVKHGGFAAASRELYITPQALCRAVSELEKTLGVELFERVGRNINPTPFAMRLYDRAQEVLNDIEELGAFVEGEISGEDECSTVSVAVVSTVTRGDVFRLNDFDRLTASYREGAYSFLFNTNGTCISALREGVVDASIVFGKVDGVGVSSVKLFSFQPIIAMDSHHPLSSAARIKLNDLDRFPLAAPTDLNYCYTLISNLLVRHGVKNAYTNVPLVKEGLSSFFKANGLAFVADDPKIIQNYPGVALCRLDPTDAFDVPVYFAYRISRQDAAMRYLRGYLIDLGKNRRKLRMR